MPAFPEPPHRSVAPARCWWSGTWSTVLRNSSPGPDVLARPDAQRLHPGANDEAVQGAAGGAGGRAWGADRVDGRSRHADRQRLVDDRQGRRLPGQPRFFSPIGVPLVTGREFTEQDVAGASKVAILNETMAKYYFGTSSPIGRRLGFGRGSATDLEIVGVVRDIRNQQLREAPVRFLYIPYAQDDSVTQLTF
ncbi:MAG: ABC transporter permease [Vicinamibacterales bacterium]